MKKLLILFAAFWAPLCPSEALSQTAGNVPNFLGTGTPSGTDEMAAQTGLKFLTTLDYPPFSFLDSNGRLSGYNVYLARLVCAELGLESKCTIQSMPWQDLESALTRGIGNAIISGVAATEENRGIFNFSNPYLRVPARFVGLTGAKAKPDFLSGLKGVKVGVISQSAYQAMARSFFPLAAVTGFANDELMYSELKSGKIDLIFGDGIKSAFWLATPDGHACCAMEGAPYYSNKFLGEGMRIAVSPSNPVLKNQIDRALSSLQRKGKLEELYLRFFPMGFY